MARWDWLGLRERRWTKGDGEEVVPAKTAWDWLQLLVVPGMLVAIAVGFNASQSAREERREDARVAEDRRRAEDIRHEQNLQLYFDRMSDLLLTHHLEQAEEPATVLDLARNLTLAALRGLDGRRKAELVAFLADSALLTKDGGDAVPGAVVKLDGADLNGADFRGIDELIGASLDRAHLRGARFDAVTLDFVSFVSADLSGASFERARITFGSFERADLRSARFDRASLGRDPGDEVSFAKACLSGSSFRRATVHRVSFRSAQGRGVDLRGARVGDLVLDDAVVTDVLGRPAGWGVRRQDGAKALRHLCAGTIHR